MKYKTLIAAVVLSVVAVTGGIGCLVSGMLIEGSLVPVAVIAGVILFLVLRTNRKKKPKEPKEPKE